ncbi:hypothetical protein [Streptomyces sp. NPDC059894]|uniref:hypothetical protein n=1 Tax=unclassified Streptomyces TaxID=2593676 RepID=UPI00365D8144
MQHLSDSDDPDDADDEEEAWDGGWTDALVTELRRSMPPGALLGLVLAADETVLQLRYLRPSPSRGPAFLS